MNKDVPGPGLGVGFLSKRPLFKHANLVYENGASIPDYSLKLSYYHTIVIFHE